MHHLGSSLGIGISVAVQLPTTLATLQAQDLVKVWVAIRARPKEICAKDLSSCLAGLCDAPRSSHHLNYYIHILMSLIHQHMLQHCQIIHIFKQKYHMFKYVYIYLYTNCCLHKTSKKSKAQVSQVDLHTKRVCWKCRPKTLKCFPSGSSNWKSDCLCSRKVSEKKRLLHYTG